MDEQEQAWPAPGASHGDAADGAHSADRPAGQDAQGGTAPEADRGAEPGEDPAQPGPQGVAVPAAEAASAEDEGPRPLGVDVVPTGHEPVDARLRRLQDADHLAVSGHLQVYEDVHGGLRETLAALDRHEK